MNNIADIAARLPKISTIDPMHCSDGTINYHLCDGGQTIAVVHEDMFDGVDVRRLAHDLMMAINALPDALRERDAAIARVEAAEADVARWRPRAEFADREVARTVADLRAALAESQAREAALREAAQRLCTLIAAEGGHGYRVHDLERALAALLADPSPAVLRMLAAVEVARAAARWRAADAALDDIDAPPHSLAICQAETDREVAGQALDAALDALDAVQDGDS